MRPKPSPELDVDWVLAVCRERVRAIGPEHAPLASRVLARLTPDRWTLEWHLPLWLGEALGLRRPLIDQLVISDLLGLAAVRLEDDIVDGEVEAAQEAAAQALSTALFTEALAPYHAWFAPDDPFWMRVDAWMAQWRMASTREAASSPDPEGLAGRAAPLRIPALAICRLAGREALFPILDRCLTHAMAALVLYDHASDWEEDLAAGRWNAFVAQATGVGRVPPGDVSRVRASVIVAMMARGAVARHFAHIEQEAATAISLAGALPSPPLIAHLRSWVRRTVDEGAAMEAHYRGAADRAVDLLLGTTSGGAGPELVSPTPAQGGHGR